MAKTANKSIPEADLDDSRLGVVYLFSALELETRPGPVIFEAMLGIVGSGLDIPSAAGISGLSEAGKAGFETANKVVESLEKPVSKGFEIGSGAYRGAQKADDSSKGLAERVKKWATKFCEEVWKALASKFQGVTVALQEVGLIATAAGKIVLKALVPFAGQAMDIAQGLVNSVDAAVDKIKTWYMGKNVHLVAGHPELAIQACKNAMTLSLFEGLFQMMKGAGGIAITAATHGAAHIVNVIVAIGEAITRAIWRLFEISSMKSFFKEAKEHWKNKGNADAIHKNAKKFADWYGKTTLYAPPVAVLTLISGICGDKMKWLMMFEGDTVVSQKKFDKGVKFIDDLKAWGARYLEEVDFEFSSSDKMVGALINWSRILDQASTSQKAWSYIKKLANA